MFKFTTIIKVIKTITWIKEYLLFYVNLMTLDYVEAIIPGDFVLASEKENSIETALGNRNVSQPGFIYSRRAEQNEGFKIREGCG